MKVCVLLGITCSAMVGMFLPMAEAVAICIMPGPKPIQLGNCQYNGWVVESGSTFDAPFPFCEHCSCNSGELICCGFNRMTTDIADLDRFLGTVGCKSVNASISCDWKAVDINDETEPCPYFEN